MSFSFGTPKTITGFTLPTTSAAPVTAGIGGAGDSKSQSKTSLFPTPAGSTTGFPLGIGGAGLGAGAPAKTASPSFGFGLPSTIAPTASTTTPNLTLGLTPVATSATPQFNLGSVAATTSTTSFTPIFGTSASLLPAASSTGLTSGGLKLTANLAPTTPATTAGTFSLTSTTPSFTLATSAPTFSLSTVATTQATSSSTISTTSLPATGALTYAQLEDSINKWTVDLEEQGKFFINQARELNAWDSLLVSNSDKILALNETIERVKQQQKQLDQELDFVLAQQNELDELSAPLEKQLADVPVNDQSRFQTYQLSEVIDSQMKQMAEDLKEIVEHLNESNKNEDISDPVVQLARILNAHMNSLTWIDNNTAQISSQLEQVSKMNESYNKIM